MKQNNKFECVIVPMACCEQCRGRLLEAGTDDISIELSRGQKLICALASPIEGHIRDFLNARKDKICLAIGRYFQMLDREKFRVNLEALIFIGERKFLRCRETGNAIEQLTQYAYQLSIFNGDLTRLIDNERIGK